MLESQARLPKLGQAIKTGWLAQRAIATLLSVSWTLLSCTVLDSTQAQVTRNAWRNWANQFQM